MTLRVNSIFFSVQGEGPDTGRPAIFIRLAGCNYRCKWCDTKYALGTEYTEMTEQEILEAIKQYPCKFVVVTGGEPFLQPIGELLLLLKQKGYVISVETNGSIYKPYESFIDKLVISPKPPSSGMKTDYKILDKLIRSFGNCCILKVIVNHEDDYQYAKNIHLDYYFTPFVFQLESEKKIDKEKANWLVQRVINDPDLNKNKVRVMVQMQKLIWGCKRGV